MVPSDVGSSDYNLSWNNVNNYSWFLLRLILNDFHLHVRAIKQLFGVISGLWGT